MNEVKLKALENACAERLRQAFRSLETEVLPTSMTFPVGAVTMDSGSYAFELRVTLTKP